MREQVNGYWRNICVIIFSHPKVAVKQPVSHKMAGVSCPLGLVFQAKYSNKFRATLKRSLDSLSTGCRCLPDFYNMIFKDFILVKTQNSLLRKLKETCKHFFSLLFSSIFPTLAFLYPRSICVHCQEWNMPGKLGSRRSLVDTELLVPPLP